MPLHQWKLTPSKSRRQVYRHAIRSACLADYRLNILTYASCVALAYVSEISGIESLLDYDGFSKACLADTVPAHPGYRSIRLTELKEVHVIQQLRLKKLAYTTPG